MYNPFFSHSMQVFFSANGSRLVTLSRRVGSRSHSQHTQTHKLSSSHTDRLRHAHKHTKSRQKPQDNRDATAKAFRLNSHRAEEDVRLCRLFMIKPLSLASVLLAHSLLSLFHLPQPSSFSPQSSRKKQPAAILHPQKTTSSSYPFTSAGRRFCCRTTAAGSRPACSSAPNCTLS